MSRFEFVITFRRVSALKKIAAGREGALLEIAKAKDRAIEDIDRAASAARKGIICARCGANVYGSEWVHGNGGYAYCLEPCWRELKQELNASSGGEA